MDIDVIKRIKDLTAERGWTEYRLVKESGIALQQYPIFFIVTPYQIFLH